MKRILTGLLAAWGFVLSAQSQTLKVGDRMPDLEWKEVFNYKANKLKLSDFKGKAILLDLWEIYCLGCIEAFPKMDSIQKRFGNNLQIIMVNRVSRDSTQRFLAKRKKIKVPDLPFVTPDTRLTKLIPHNGVPVHIWIDKNGIIQAITGGLSTTASNVQRFLNGENLALREYKYKQSYPSLVKEEWQDKMEYYSMVSKCINGVKLNDFGRKDYEGISTTCQSIEGLYQDAYNEYDKHTFDKGGRTIWEVKDKSLYILPEDLEKREKWMDDHTFNYQSLVPKNRGINLYKLMQEDLQRYFNLEASIETRLMPSLVLVKLDTIDRLASKGGRKAWSFYAADLNTVSIEPVRGYRNYPFEEFISRFGFTMEYHLKKPFINTVKYRGNIDLEMPGEVADAMKVEDLRKELRKYGLDMLEMPWPVEVLVIKEKNGN